jgi:hypothetical protein
MNKPAEDPPAASPEVDVTIPVSETRPRPKQIFRRFVKLGRHVRMLGQFVSTRFSSRALRDTFKDVQHFAFFLGYPFSGTSLMGSLLDAHPNAVIAHEMQFLRYFKYGFNRDQIFQLLLRNSEAMAQEGRVQNGYPYNVPNQSQGKFTQIRVIGDKRSSTVLRMVDRHPGLLEKFEKAIGVPLKRIHMIRNPFDNIATICQRSSTGRLDEAVEYYFWLVKILSGVRERTPRENLFDLKHEALIADPKGSLKQGCEFLGLVPTEEYLKDCASIVFSSPRKTRFKVPWAAKLKDQVQAGIEKVDFLRGYSYDE